MSDSGQKHPITEQDLVSRELDGGADRCRHQRFEVRPILSRTLRGRSRFQREHEAENQGNRKRYI